MLVTSVDMRIHRSWYITIQQTCGYIAYGCIREGIWMYPRGTEMYLREDRDVPESN